MNLYEVVCQRMLESFNPVLVIAETEEHAFEIAEERYDAAGISANHLSIRVLCEDTSQEWSTEPRDY